MATTLYFLVHDQTETAVLEHGIGLSFSGWERQLLVPQLPPTENSLLIRGQQLVATDCYLHTETIYWSPLAPEDEPVEVVLTGERFILTPAGIHFQGELELATVKGGRKKEPLSVLLPQQVPAGSVLVGEAKLQAWKVVEPGKAPWRSNLAGACSKRKHSRYYWPRWGRGVFLWRLLHQKPDLERPNPG